MNLNCSTYSQKIIYTLHLSQKLTALQTLKIFSPDTTFIELTTLMALPMGARPL